MNDDLMNLELLRKKLEYYERQLDKLSGDVLNYDLTISGFQHELRQKRQGYALLSELQQTIGVSKEISSIFEIVIQAINATLGMDKTLILSPTDRENYYRPTQWVGFIEGTIQRLPSLYIEFPPDLAKGTGIILVNKSSERTPLIEKIQSTFDLPYFICLPVRGEKAPLGLLLSGKLKEAKPFYPPLDQGDIDTCEAITDMISAFIRRMRVDELTKINRDLEHEVAMRKRTEEKLRIAEEEATKLSEFLKNMFGRYLSTEVMNSLLEDPSGLELGGERRDVTIMMSDLRGFTSITERLEPEQVVKMLNSYFEVMVEIIHQYNGTINEIIGDSLLVIFGAPQQIPDRAQRAIACAVDMQNAMVKVNEENHSQDLPELEMGIGLHDTEVIVGNIGSSKRIKYSVVGSGVNLVSRIESYTVGGQILISESVRQETGDILRIDGQSEVLPKGTEVPLRIYDIGGIAGRYNLALEKEDSDLVALTQKISLQYTILEGKHIGKTGLEGFVVKLSKKSAKIILDEPVEQFTNLKMNLKEVYEELAVKDIYGKVTEVLGEDGHSYMIKFTSVPPEVVSYFLAHQQYAAKEMST
jgi:class 3 adenylate cyclase